MITCWFLGCRVYSMSIISLFFLLIFAPSSYCQEEDEDYRECVNKFDCGNLRDLSYPFFREGRSKICGYEGFNLQCRDNEFPVISIVNQEFLVISVHQSQNEMTIASRDLWVARCPADSTFHNITLDTNLFNYTPDFYAGFSNISLFYNCTNLQDSVPHIQRFSCSVNGEERDAFYGYDELWGGWKEETDKCNIRVEVPVPNRFLGSHGVHNLEEAIRQGFNVSYKYNETCLGCRASGGICGTNITTLGFTCLCPDQPYPVSCPNQSGSDPTVKLKVGIGLVGSFGTVSIMCILFYSYLRCKKNPHAPSAFVSQTKTNSDFYSKYHMEKGGSILEETTNNFEAFLEKHGSLGVKRYSYSQVKKMTNSFKEKLGQGGYGSVYKGMLLDGCHVAVKMLNVSKGEGEEFINEVAAISRTSHVNVVTLMGFCLEGHKRALVYEFMPNGSLDKFISHTTTLNIGQHLGWETIHQIAIGIAEGLEYLHRGCNTRIVHFDIKPHNVLLDENLTPKISDFGLAKLCTRRESIVSMSEARGTIGYIAPEVFCRNFGQVSSKSDVYSYGMMILEIVGGRKKDIQQVEGSDECSEMYFPNWIYKSLELTKNKENLVEEEEEGELIVRKLKLIGLWCIQTNPLDRPTMGQVIQMLQGSIQTLSIPPKPFLSSSSSPPLFAMYSSTISTL